MGTHHSIVRVIFDSHIHLPLNIRTKQGRRILHFPCTNKTGWRLGGGREAGFWQGRSSKPNVIMKPWKKQCLSSHWLLQGWTST